MEIGVRLVGLLLTLVDFITSPIFWLISWFKPHRPLPPIKDNLLVTSASELARLIRNKKVTSQHVVEVFIDRVKAVNPILNAVVEDRFKDAIEEAKIVDELLKTYTTEASINTLEKTKPFFGVPLTVKESCALKGMSLCGGSLPRSGVQASSDGEAVSCLREAGAIPILVSTTPELCLSWQTNNLVTGVTCNPYDTNRTPGGSSGGEAALIGGGASVIGISSDIAGSIRIPAMFTGIFGHKPTPGLISIVGHFPNSTDENFAEFLTLGPLARYAEDLDTMLRVMSGKNYYKLNPEEDIVIKNLKVIYMMTASDTLSLTPMEPSIKDVMLKAINFLKNELGADVESTKFEMDESVEMSISAFFSMDDIPNMLRDENNPKVSKNLYFEILKSLFGLGTHSLPSLGFYLIHHTNVFIPKSATNKYKEQGNRLKKKMLDVLGTNGIFLYPTFPTPAYYHNQVYTKASGVIYTMLFNVLGMPSTHVPLGLDSDGLPIGIQVIAAPFQDRLCIAVAKELEKGFGGWIPPFKVIT